MRTKIKVVFFGTPEFAVPALAKLLPNYNVVAVVTQPDKRAGRHARILPPQLKIFALEHHIPIYQPNSIKLTTKEGEKFHELFKNLRPDIAAVVAYGKIIPLSLLKIPRYGFVNVHGSLLPALRGPSPIQHAILRGLKQTGVTIMVMDEGMDTGPILASQKITIAADETAAILHDKLKILGADLLCTTLAQYISGAITPQSQPQNSVSYCPLIKKNDGAINWQLTPPEIERLIRAYTPWPGAYTFYHNKRVKILSAQITVQGELKILVVQAEGKKPMSYADFLRGHGDCVLPPVN